MKISLNHKTHYDYDKAVMLSPQIIRLRPAPHCIIPIDAYTLKITPEKHFINWQQDPVGNHIAYVTFFEPTNHFDVEVDLIVNTVSINPFDFFIDSNSATMPISYSASEKNSLQTYLTYQESSKVSQWIEHNKPETTITLDFIVALNQQLFDTITYQVRLEEGVQTPDETLTSLVGSCRDTAWLQCIMLRHLGFATRFVSGYLIQLISSDSKNAVKTDSLDLHAWTEVFIPGAGWIGLDPTSGMLAAENHVPLCATAHPQSSAPIEGTVSPCGIKMSHTMNLNRLNLEDTISDTPLNPSQWDALNTLGYQVDKALNDNNVQLTIGGEPTYVDESNLNDTQWQTEALGKSKFNKGQLVLKDLQDTFAKNGVSMLSQGKWYPGESKPRWALNCFWRKDGEAIWEDTRLLYPKENKTINIQSADRFIKEVSAHFNLDNTCITPLYEDIPYQLWQLGKVGGTVDLDSIRDHEHHMRNLYDQNINTPAGFSIPLHWDFDNKQWSSCLWEVKSKKLTLLPGDASAGYRIPLDKLSENFVSCVVELPDKSSFSSAHKLTSHHDLMSQSVNKHPSACINQFISSALCVEVKNHILHVFIPPIKPLSAYLQLMAKVELVAVKLNMKIQLEGYRPPLDNRIQSFSVTPDPGVLEINIQPAHNWQELVHIHSVLDKVTKKHGLSAKKYDLDGRVIGTGGGCHITLGSTTAAESPFLRQPDLLQSMLTFWQHHPSLSYLFSGRFIGATSQAPRIDEARHDSLFELELAFQDMPKGEVENYWLVDRLLRHILVDVTGNTHRAEFCIDKLFSPDSEFGRQGLLELRAFEMQTHPQLICAQNLLIRALVCAFKKQPYQHRLIRWGTELHDRFMLPHFIWDDFKTVLGYLKNHDFEFDLDCFKPIFDFRFPLIGEIQLSGVNLELRNALEPWPVLGEESQNGHTSRCVDSTLERIQLKVTGFTEQKLAITCNNVLVPLHSTGTPGEYIAGIKLKAWNFSNCLHPNIPTIQKLVFDLIDQRLGRSIGGCQYYTQHPGGKNSDELPINGREAETRRNTRFQAFGHTPGEMRIEKSIENFEHPYTLDLRLHTIKQNEFI